ncbi:MULTISPECIES: hypothetical protein [Rhizobium]|jgi:hypothetical protein|uniref:Uncharacterized protein n=1 Tax=Rhizobium soli TaxID=424798 RepID=A0A7X0JG36_9HYPH|nr:MULTISPECIES: hypothetical protein [Rhizobium]MBB6506946.1 hypothetical protein [Rhizobium soli]MBP2461534.1 hypothetical protein [Rhizobium sp. PvP014]MBP2528929.1 hypothetical protein [Rhizobium sp. PvP099]SEH22691.1 hypothetical protein SAMN03159407_1304 [Rhizobium sp. NFR12]
MNFAAAFYLYILPLSISGIALVWMAYEKWKERRRPPHAGE